MYKRYWIVKFFRNGFEGIMLAYGTEMELWEYMKTELSDSYSYVGATEADVLAAKSLGVKTYLCPELVRQCNKLVQSK